MNALVPQAAAEGRGEESPGPSSRGGRTRGKKALVPQAAAGKAAPKWIDDIDHRAPLHIRSGTLCRV